MGLIYGNKFLEEECVLEEFVFKKFIDRIKNKKSKKVEKKDKSKTLFIDSIKSEVRVYIENGSTFEEEKEKILEIFNKINFDKEVEKEFKKYIKREFGPRATINKFKLSSHNGTPNVTVLSSGEYSIEFNYYSYECYINSGNKVVDKNDKDSQHLEDGWYVYFTVSDNKIKQVDSNYID